ncbi:MAG: UDP-N-acetylglucosamine 2-epimerase [Acidobacteriota bacterium]|nr:UDP-N-acetylglucosamine 2-epimerase [Acidobacteriota bacterium]
MSTRRRIAIFTGNRAEYGLQFPILRAVSSDPRFEYYLLVGGAHLQQDFGNTRAEIEADGLTVHREVEIDMPHDTLYATAQAIGTGVLSIARILDELRPDVMVVYADRFESFAAMIAGTQMNVPTAHVEGGDYTEGGALDDSVRHAMTKLAHLHFATNEAAAERIRRLGEEPWRVHVVGLPALDLVAGGEFSSPDAIAADLGLDTARPVVLFCQHSVTTEFEEAAAQVRPSLVALEALAREGVQIVLTYPNNDAGGRRIIDELVAFAGRRVPNTQLHKSLGRARFHGVLNLIGSVTGGAMVSNSSAGIKETPAFKCASINVGSRQQGRLRGANIIDTGYDAAEIEAAVRRALGDAAYRRACVEGENPYGAGNAGARIADVLATVPLDARLLQKKMTY